MVSITNFADVFPLDLLIFAVSAYDTLRKMCPYSELFWFAFSRVRTEHGEIRSMRSRITPNMDTFHAVTVRLRGKSESNQSRELNEKQQYFIYFLFTFTFYSQ